MKKSVDLGKNVCYTALYLPADRSFCCAKIRENANRSPLPDKGGNMNKEVPKKWLQTQG